jgi:oligosaccharide repeat unit polymerase
MTGLVGFMLALLAMANASYANSCLYPPFIFTSVWSILLLGLTLAGNVFYPLSSLTLIIYFTGALSFSVGGVMALAIFNNQATMPKSVMVNRTDSFLDKILNWGLAAQIVIAPLYIKRLLDISSLANVDSFLIGVRLQTSTGFREDRFGIYSYIISIVRLLALTSFYEMDTTQSKKRRAYLYIAIALIYQLLTAARTGAILTLISLFIIAAFKTRKINIKAIVSGVAIFLLLFSIPAVLLNKGGSLEQGFVDNLASLMQSMRDYTLPSLVAFDKEVREQQGIGTSFTSFRSIFVIANLFGAHYEIPSAIPEYTATPVPTNLYTMYYFYYKDFGLSGTLFMMFFLGSVCTFLYTAARNNKPAAIIMYSMIATSLILSGLSEPFLSSVSFWIQAILFVIILYGLRFDRAHSTSLQEMQ